MLCDGLVSMVGMAENRVILRLSPDQLATLDELAEEHGGSRSAAMRALIDAVQAGGSPGTL